MPTVLIQAFLTALAAFALWRCWRRFVAHAREDRAVVLIAAAGFAGRALVGQVLFWISWLRLPVLRSLQLGDGFWFFAPDGAAYLRKANELLQGGFGAFEFEASYPSHVFTELLAICVAVFGSVASVAILINCAAYLGACILLLHIRSPDRRARLVALFAISFGPGAVLWSLQPLKDSLFLFLVVALVAALAAWQRVWRAAEPAALASALTVLAVVYALAGLRWYFAVIVWGASAIFLLLVALGSVRRRRAVLYGAALFVSVAIAVRLGGAGDMVPVMSLLRDVVRSESSSAAPIPSAKRYVAEVRKGFENTPGATTIAAGPAIPSSAARPAPSSPTPVVRESAPAQPRPPQTTVARLITGAAAMFLPRMLAERLGLIDIRGGRGLWLFVELDTLFFDAVALFAVGYAFFALRRSRPSVTPLFVLVLLVFVATAGPMIYSVSNFGTMFRLRQVLYVLLALLPLTLDGGRRASPSARVAEERELASTGMPPGSP